MQNPAPSQNFGGAGCSSTTGDLEGGSSVQRFRVEGSLKAQEVRRYFAGDRWPHGETVALLNIRSDMNAVFRDFGTKAPLWEEVSRKLSELGYCRSTKKCREKFENICKYHRRTRESRLGHGQNRKKYRFSEDLKALNIQHPPNVDVNHGTDPCFTCKPLASYVDTSILTPYSSEEESGGVDNNNKKAKKKKKLDEFLGRLMREVKEKQENMQKKLMKTIERLEQGRMVREEVLRMQETQRINRERELLVQKRSIAVAKDTAVLAFLQKLSEQACSMDALAIEVDLEMASQAHSGGENVYGMPEFQQAGSISVAQGRRNQGSDRT